MKTKFKGKYYIVGGDSNCYKRSCFVPFEGNGQRICRLYELGQCKYGLPESHISGGKESER